MSLTQALSTAVAGLRANQVGLSIVSANVANADTPGYIRKTPIQITSSAGESGVSVRIAGVNRQLDIYVQRQLRTETSGASYAALRAEFYERLQSVYGVPGSDAALTTVFDKFVSGLQAVAASPDSSSARTAVLSSAEVLAQQLRAMSGDLQALRSDAEHGLLDATNRANEAMERIASLNRELGTTGRSDAATATLLDDRDRYINELAQLMDIVVVPTDHNQVTVFTNSGIQLVGIQASQIAFDAKGMITPQAQWSADTNERGVGTLMLVGANSGDIDLVAAKAIRSGAIATYLEMRDKVLVEAQAQLDEIAAAMSSALSDHTVAGTPVTSGAEQGFDLDIGALADGNTISLTYTETSDGIPRRVSLIRVNDPTALPLSNDATSDPNDRVIGIDFSGGMATALASLNAALGGRGLAFSNPAGTTLRILDDGLLNRVTINAASATVTETALASGNSELPFFLDASSAYTGAFTGAGQQKQGLAARIAVNRDLIADPSKLVVYQTGVHSADATRPNFLLDRLTGSAMMFSPDAGIGTKNAPYSAALPAYLRQVVSQQGDAAAAAASLNDGQQVVLQALQARFNEDSAVNVDMEMANLLSLQNAYAANARVLSTIREMIDTLMRM